MLCQTCGQPLPAQEETVTFGPWVLDIVRYSASLPDGHHIQLPRIPFMLAVYFARHPNQVITREQLKTIVSDRNHQSIRLVDVYIKRLRSEFNIDARDGYLRTVKFSGYEYVPPGQGRS